MSDRHAQTADTSAPSAAGAGGVADTAVRYEVDFEGRVQGVGFRATTERLARDFAVAGWVRNEPDGTVHMVLEGAKPELDRFLDAQREHLGRFIRRRRVTEARAEGEQGFRIAR